MVSLRVSIDVFHLINDTLGVRNHVAKNNLKSMQKGEHAFFYHSNCKVPGVAGILEIVEEASVDGKYPT